MRPHILANELLTRTVTAMLRILLSSWPGLLALVLTSAAQAQTVYRIDPDASALVYAMHHPAHEWTGTSHRVSGTIQAEKAHVGGGHIAALVMSFDSGNRSRDSNMASDTEAYLCLNVEFERVRYASDGTATVEGALTFHGVTRPVTMPAEISLSDDTAHVREHFEVTLPEVDLKRPSLMMVKARDWLGLEVDLITHPS